MTIHSQNMNETIPVADHMHGVATRAVERGEETYSLISNTIAAVDCALRAVWDARKSMTPAMTEAEFEAMLDGTFIEPVLFESEERRLTDLREQLSAWVRADTARIQ